MGWVGLKFNAKKENYAGLLGSSENLGWGIKI
jgi:hypothetical protein